MFTIEKVKMISPSNLIFLDSTNSVDVDESSNVQKSSNIMDLSS